MSDVRTAEAFDGDATGRDAGGVSAAAACGSTGATFLVETGYCGRCGYDLRGSPGPLCPECGSRIDPDALSALRWWTERRTALRDVLLVQTGASFALIGPPLVKALQRLPRQPLYIDVILTVAIPIFFAGALVILIAAAAGLKWCFQALPLTRHWSLNRSLYSVGDHWAAAFGAALATLLILASLPAWPFILLAVPAWLPAVATIMAVVENLRLRRARATGSALIIPPDAQRNLHRLVGGIYALLAAMAVGGAIFVRAFV